MAANPVLVQLKLLLQELGYPSAGTTNVPQVLWTATGPQVPDQAAVLAGVILDINAAFGGNLNPQFTTPQGQLASSFAAAISNCYALNSVMLVNGMDPDTNSGFMQDVIGRIYFINRMPGTPTLVTCTCTGAVGTAIPTGALATDTAGNVYACTQGGTIGSSGNITLIFANVVVGPIPCPASTLTRIAQSITGWESITNPSDGTLGTNIESREAFEFRREQSIAANSQAAAVSVYGAVIDLPGVTDAFVYENQGDSPIVVGSTLYTLVAHSIYVGVTGGSSAAIGNAFWTKKNPGSNTNGNTSVTVLDPTYSFPQPQYVYNYQNCGSNPITINLVVNIINSAALPGSIVADVQAAVTATFAADSRARIGALFLTGTYYGPVSACEGPSVPVDVTSIGIGGAFTGQGTLVNTQTTLTITTASTGSLVAGAVLTGTSIPTGAQIVKQLTGTPGGVGTYQMSAAATGTVSSPESITASATGTSYLIGIDMQPVLGTVTVNLL